MTSWKLLTSAWSFDPSVVVGTLLLLTGYLVAARWRWNRYTGAFLAGVAVMFFALVSPLDPLGDDYLFSAHMAQHILLDLVAPPLFVAGLPPEWADKVLANGILSRVELVLGNPLVAWTMGVGTLWIWHLPALYDATLRSETVHIFEHVSFLVTGTVLFWPVFAPAARRRLSPLLGVAYLAVAATANATLGIIFTLASTPYYAGYQHPDDELGALSLIRNQWGLDVIADQQLGGALMWAVGSLVFLSCIMVVVVRWFGQPGGEGKARF